MRIKSFMLTACMAAVLASCAKDENLENGGNPSFQSGDGYISVAFSFPSDVRTRANGDFADGVGAESKITTMAAYFFDQAGNMLGKTDKVKLGLETPGEEDGSIEKKIDVEVPATLVSYLNADNEDGLKTASMIAVLNGVTLPEAETDSYDSFNDAISADISTVTASTGFMMTNSNYIKEGKETAKVIIKKENIGVKGSTLVTPVPPTTVTVPVERVAAKVTLAQKPGATLNIVGWGLNVTNKSYFPVKKFTDEFLNDADKTVISKYTTAWPMNTAWNSADNFRSYWAVDPNYSTTDINAFNLLDLSAENAAADPADALYCLENTFDEARQRTSYTTTAVIVAQFTPTDATSTTDDKTWVRWENQNYLATDFVSTVFDKAKDGIQKYWYKLEDGTHKQLISANFKIGVADETKKIEIGGKVVGYHSAATVVLDKLADNADADNLYTLKEGENGKKDEDWEAVVWAKAIKEIDETIAAVYGENNAPLVYVNGYGYYEVPIRHFNDIEVPWDKQTVNQPKHLGRYGIVRNNSYQLTINSIMNPGNPVIGGEIKPEDRPDDDLKYYLDVEIDVLRWAVRSQDVDL